MRQQVKNRRWKDQAADGASVLSVTPRYWKMKWMSESLVLNSVLNVRVSAKLRPAAHRCSILEWE